MAVNDFPFHLEPPQQRGGCLSVVLIALMVLYAIATVSVAALLFGVVKGAELPDTFTPGLAKVALGVAIAAAVGAFGIWRWRRWGMYLFAASAGTALAMEVHLREPVVGAPFHVTALIVVAALLWGRWRHFD